MHGDMHTIQSCAYQICTVHIRYIHACIPLYLHVSVCIYFFPEMYLVHIWMYLQHMNEKYRQIHADMHYQRSAYLHVSVCICLYFIPDKLMVCTRYIQICTPSRSAYLYVSACICLYFFPEYLRICTEYIQIHAWFIAPVRPPAGPSNHLAGDGTADAAAGLVHPHRRAVVARSPRGHSGSAGAGAGEKIDTFIWITATAGGNLNSRAVARWSALVHLPVVYLEAKE